MMDKIVTLEDNKNYVILDETVLQDIKYYYGLRLNNQEEPTNNYIFFCEYIDGENTYLAPVEEDNIKELLLTAFTINFIGKVYDEI